MFMKTMNANVLRSCEKDEAGLIGGLLLGIVLFVALMFFCTTTALATVIHVTSFEGAITPSQPLAMNLSPLDSLLVRVGEVDKSIVDAGYGIGSWNLCLTNSAGTPVGWAQNSSLNPTRKGWLTGYYSSLLGDGGRPSHAFLVYDSTGNGWDIVDSIIGSPQDLLDGDLFFNESNILFGPDKLLGAVGLLPAYIANNGGAAAILPKMTVIIPEPATLTILTLGALSLIRKRFNK